MLTSHQKRQIYVAIIGHYSHYFDQNFVFFEKKSNAGFLFVEFFSQVQWKVKFISKIFSGIFDFLLNC
jgi:hypothetical protein